MTTNHTPTPWIAEIHEYNGKWFDIIRPGATATRDAQVASGMKKEDAAFIVRCVNAHDELVAALSGLADSWQFALSKDAAEKDAFREALLNARAALAKVQA